MIDCFALLRQPRRPWLEESPLREQFQAQSGAVHPDRWHAAPDDEKARVNQRFAELNAAFNCLRSPHARARHLVELESGRPPGDLANVPNELVDAFMRIAAASRHTETLVAQKARLQSPLLLAGFLDRIQPHLRLLEQLEHDVASLQSAALDRLRAIDNLWISGGDPAALLPQLAELTQVLGFLARWQTQLRESQLRLLP